TWGIAFDDFGQSFGVDNDNTSIKYFLPGSSMAHTPGERHILDGLVHNKPKYCGADFVATKHFPDDWQGNYVTCDFRAHRVARYKFTDAGAGFAAEELEPLVVSDNVAFRPIDVKFGPDGALYVCDWYNPIINHGEVDFRDSRRDKTQGRIWRITAKGRPAAARPKIADAPIADLLELQKSPEGPVRHFARRTLTERPRAEVLTALAEWAPRQIEEPAALAALWSYQTVDAPNEAALRKVLAAKDGRLRAAAVRVLDEWQDRLPDAEKILAERVRDDHPRVRLEAVRALARRNSTAATAAALTALKHPMDPFLDYALKLTARQTAGAWLPTVTADPNDPAVVADPGGWVYALLSLDGGAAGPLLRLVDGGSVPADLTTAVWETAAKQGTPTELRQVLDTVLAGKLDAAANLKAVQALAEASRLRGAKPDGDRAAGWLKLTESTDPILTAAVYALAGAWREPAAAPVLLKAADDDARPKAVRSAAFNALAVVGGEPGKVLLQKYAAAGVPNELRMAALKALATADPAEAARSVVAFLKEGVEPVGLAPLVQPLLQQKTGPTALGAALVGVSLSEPVAREGLRLTQATGQLLPDLSAAWVKAGGLKISPWPTDPNVLRRLARQALTTGDAGRGEKVFRRDALGCVKCHVVKGVGGLVGPDLTTIGASAPGDYLVESLLAPDAKIKENYHSMIVATAEGTVLTGVPVRKTADEIVLRNAENKLISIATRDIEESRMGGSLMPANLMDSLSQEEFFDLVVYLTDLGKTAPPK
ncbi:MAG: DUF7133 domain-containing protein, partial [Planctomycetia bacterium]